MQGWTLKTAEAEGHLAIMDKSCALVQWNCLKGAWNERKSSLGGNVVVELVLPPRGAGLRALQPGLSATTAAARPT
ncbi:MAG: hypothetical protein ACTS4Z_01440 [Candidatus Hodgkinia cicadicola]